MANLTEKINEYLDESSTSINRVSFRPGEQNPKAWREVENILSDLISMSVEGMSSYDPESYVRVKQVKKLTKTWDKFRDEYIKLSDMVV